jgi:hypothetical protein
MNTTLPVTFAVLGDSPDYRVRAEDIDPRGWSIIDANGVTLGTVADLIIDVDTLIARYIVCSVQRIEARSVLLPIGFARLNSEDKVVHLDFVTMAAIANLPTFAGLPIKPEQLADTEKALTGVAPTTSAAAKIVRRTDETRNAS